MVEYRLSDIICKDKTVDTGLTTGFWKPRPLIKLAEDIRLRRGDRITVGDDEWRVVFHGGYHTARLVRVCNAGAKE